MKYGFKHNSEIEKQNISALRKEISLLEDENNDEKKNNLALLTRVNCKVKENQRLKRMLDNL